MIAGGTLRDHPAAAIDITVPYLHALWVALVSGDEGAPQPNPDILI